MRYYKQIIDDVLVSIGTGNGGVEITKEEYDALFAEIQEKASLSDRLYDGDIVIEDVPESWRDEIQRRVEEREELEATIQNGEISDDEFVAMLEGIM